MRINKECSNLSLILNKGFESNNYEPTPDEKGTFWGRIVERSNLPIGYQAFLDDVTVALGAGKEYKFNQRVAVGLGISTRAERGISLHHLFGTPIFPGSGIKGMMLREALFQLDLLKAGFDCDPFVWRKVTGVAEADSVKLQQMQALFGDAESAGRLKVYDALWVPSNGPYLRHNIDTVHNVNYYKSWATDKINPPDDTDAPNPIKSVTLAKGIKMRFWLDAGDEAWTKASYDLLDLALKRLGIGAKTSSGFGRIDSAPQGGPAGAEKVANKGIGEPFEVEVLSNDKNGVKARHDRKDKTVRDDKQIVKGLGPKTRILVRLDEKYPDRFVWLVEIIEDNARTEG